MQHPHDGISRRLYLLLVQLAPAAMEVNRDEAERCIDIAIAALTSDQPEKAQRFLEKAQRLFPTEKAKGELKWPCPSKGAFQLGGT